MVADSALRDEPFTTDGTDERVEPGVTSQMGHQTALLFEQSTTLRTTAQHIPGPFSGHLSTTYCKTLNFGV